MPRLPRAENLIKEMKENLTNALQALSGLEPPPVPPLPGVEARSLEHSLYSGLSVNGFGRITTDAMSEEAFELLAVHNGLDPRTITDNFIPAHQLSFGNPRWSPYIEPVLGRAKSIVDPEDLTDLTPVGLVVSKRGSAKSFQALANIETQGYIIITLPSKYCGGHLAINNPASGNKIVSQLDVLSEYDIQVIGFQSDSFVSIGSITEGFRIALIYSLRRVRHPSTPVADFEINEAKDDFRRALRDWRALTTSKPEVLAFDVADEDEAEVTEDAEDTFLGFCFLCEVAVDEGFRVFTGDVDYRICGKIRRRLYASDWTSIEDAPFDTEEEIVKDIDVSSWTMFGANGEETSICGSQPPEYLFKGNYLNPPFDNLEEVGSNDAHVVDEGYRGDVTVEKHYYRPVLLIQAPARA